MKSRPAFTVERHEDVMETRLYVRTSTGAMQTMLDEHGHAVDLSRDVRDNPYLQMNHEQGMAKLCRIQDVFASMARNGR